MSWYTVVKTINRRRYKYRQRTYRAGGKVRTQSQYLGPVTDADRAQALPVTTLEDAAPQAIEVVDRTAPSLKVDSAVRQRADLSIQALEREEALVKDLMHRNGLNTTNLLPVQVGLGRSIGRATHQDAYAVHATRSGQRNTVKREFRKALAARWIDALRDQDPERYAVLCDSLSSFHHWTMSGVRPAWLGFLADLWHRRRRGHHVAVEMAAEAIQRGAVQTQRRYAKASGKSEKEAERAWRRFHKLKQPAARSASS
jgi:hypothetical protein